MGNSSSGWDTEPGDPLSHLCRILASLTLLRFLQITTDGSESVRTIACQYFTAVLPILHLLLHLSQCSRSLVSGEETDIDVPCKAEHAVFFSALWALTATHSKKRLLCLGLKAVSVYGHQHKYVYKHRYKWGHIMITKGTNTPGGFYHSQHNSHQIWVHFVSLRKKI